MRVRDARLRAHDHRRVRRAALSTAALCIGVGWPVAACRPRARATESRADAAAPVAARASAVPSEAEAGVRSQSSADGRPRCRVLVADGDVRREGGAPLVARAEVDGDEWIRLAPHTRLVVKSGVTSREATFHGPGRVRACVDARDESWLAGGEFESSLGAGDGPGAETWVVTELGVFRFTASRLSVEARAGRVALHVASGPAFAWLADGTAPRVISDASAPGPPGDEGWTRVTGTLEATAARPEPTLERARTALASCASRAEEARALARALLGGASVDAGAPLERGRLAGRQVTARRLARAACAVAALQVDELPPSPAQEELVASLATATPLWRALPTSP